MNRVDCHQLDERLMDYLYEELDTREMDEMRAHVEGCPRCSAEVGRFRGVRRAVAQLEMADPPPAVSAKLLHQAASMRRESRWRRSRALRTAVYATPIVAMAAAFVLFIHVKDRALSDQIRPEDVTLAGNDTTEGQAPASPHPAIAAPPREHESKAEERGVFTTPKEADQAQGREEGRWVGSVGKAPVPLPPPIPAQEASAKASRGGEIGRKVEFKPPVTKDTTLGKAAHGQPADAAADVQRHAAPVTGGSGRGETIGRIGQGGYLGGRSGIRGDTGGTKMGGDTSTLNPPALTPPPKPAVRSKEIAKAEVPPHSEQQQKPVSRFDPSPPPPPAAAPAEKKAAPEPQVSTASPGANVQLRAQNEGNANRYRSLPSQAQQVPQRSSPVGGVAESPSSADLDETRAQTRDLVSKTQRETAKQVTTPPDQLYAQLVTNTNSGNDCTRVMDLVKQLESWNYWGNQHPNEMRNAYLLRGRCQNDNKLADKDYENARRISQEQEKNDYKRASKGKRAPSKGKPTDNSNAGPPADAVPAKK